jgi:hypothetical protein
MEGKSQYTMKLRHIQIKWKRSSCPVLFCGCFCSRFCVSARQRECVVLCELHLLKRARRTAELWSCRRGEARVGPRCGEKRRRCSDWLGRRAAGEKELRRLKVRVGRRLVAHEQMHERSLLPDDRCTWGCLKWREGHAALGNVFHICITMKVCTRW